MASHKLKKFLCFAALSCFLVPSIGEAMRLTKLELFGLEKENFARLTFRDEEQGRSKTLIDDDGFLVSYAMHSYMGRLARHQKDQPLTHGFLIGALLTESFQHARTKYLNKNMPRAVTIAEQGWGAAQNWSATNTTPLHFFETVGKPLSELFNLGTLAYSLEGNPDEEQSLQALGLGLSRFSWKNGTIQKGDPNSSDEQIFWTIEDVVFQELAGIPRLAEAVQEQTQKQEHHKQIDQQFPMTAVWTAEKAQAQTRSLVAIFKAFQEEKKGLNFAFMPSSFYAVLAPLWELWLRNNPNDPEVHTNSPIYISISDARYQQERLVRSGVLRTGLLFYRDRPLEESTALALQSSGMECMTGAMSPEELVRRVNLFSSKVTEGMIPEAIKRELVPTTPALLIAASEYIKVLWRDVFTSIGDAEFILEGNKRIQVPFMKTETFYTHKYREKRVDGKGTEKMIQKEILSIPMKQEIVLSLFISDDIISDKKPLDLDLFRMPKLPTPKVDPWGMAPPRPKLTMPKWEFETTANLLPVLKTLGCPVEKTLGDGAYLTIFQQQNKVKVDEMGLEAAATTVAVALRCGNLDDRTINRPFTFVFTYQPEGTTPEVLLMGTVVDPSLH